MLRRINNQSHGGAASRQLLRLMLYKGEVCRLPKAYTSLCVVSGHGWLTVGGQDITLGPGEKLSLAARDDIVLISALRDTPLIFELRAKNQAQSSTQLPLTAAEACC